MKQQLEQADTLQVDSVALRDSIMRSAGIDSAALALRDSLYKAVYVAVSRGGFAGGTSRLFSTYRFALFLRRLKKQAGIESSGTCGLPWRFFYRRRYYGGRFPFRDAEGIWGGVGFVPVISVAAQFRPTVEQRASGWTTWSMLTDHEHGYTLSGMMFEANEENASIHVKTTERYPELQTFSSLKLIYEQNKNTEMRLVCNASSRLFTRDALRHTS